MTSNYTILKTKHNHHIIEIERSRYKANLYCIRYCSILDYSPIYANSWQRQYASTLTEAIKIAKGL